MPAKRIYLFRHGETDLNRHGIVQGSGVDAGLNERGKQQSEAFFRKYGRQPFEVVITSGLRRTHETVAPFLEAGLPWQQFAELNEIGWGRHEGKKSTREMIEEYEEVLASWQHGDLRKCLAGGESAAEMAARLIRFAERLKARNERQLLICSHGRAMRCLLCILRGMPPTAMDQFNHSNTALYIFEQDGNRFKPVLTNDTSHLSGQEAQGPPSDNPSQNEASQT